MCGLGEHAARHRELAEKAHSSDRLAWNHLGDSFAKMMLGRLAEAEVSATQGLEIATGLGDERLAIFIGTWHAQTIAEAGRFDEATEHADRLVEWADTLGLNAGQLTSRHARAYVALLAGDHETVLEHTRESDKLLEGSDEEVYPVWLAPIACQALIATGQLDEAEQRLKTTLEATRRFDMPHWEAMSLKARGMLHAARGEEEAARKDLDAAIEIFERLESRLELARTLVLRGDDDDVTRARDLFQSSGAPLPETS